MGSMQGDRPINMPAVAAVSTLAHEGLTLIKTSGANTVEISTTVNDAVVGVLDQPVVDMTGTARATRTGEKVGVFPTGCGKIVYVASLTTMTWTVGCAVYNAQTSETAGCVNTSSANSATKIGHYVGAGEVTAADYDLIPVVLDTASIT